MSPSIIDLRTDFVSRPTDAMIDAMIQAARSEPVFDIRADPFVQQLEVNAARILGKADALFCPTCMMANQIAINVFCRPGENFVTAADSHIVMTEAGAASALSGAVPRQVRAYDGVLQAEDIEKAIHPDCIGRTRTALICLENTHVHSGGRVTSVPDMKDIRDVAGRASIPIHLDGSLVFNAAASLGVDVTLLTEAADSVAVSMNKGLGAPLGAMLAGEEQFIAEASKVRQMFGGGWRPCSIPAAAANVALETMIDRLGEDHRRARRLASALASSRLLDVDPDQVQTNIVFGSPKKNSVQELVNKLQLEGVLVHQTSSSRIRMVTYHNVGDAEIDRTIEVFDYISRK